jgi:hypothetical protein
MHLPPAAPKIRLGWSFALISLTVRIADYCWPVSKSKARDEAYPWQVRRHSELVLFEHCAELPGQCVEQMKLYGEASSDGWTAELEWQRADYLAAMRQTAHQAFATSRDRRLRVVCALKLAQNVAHMALHGYVR